MMRGGHGHRHRHRERGLIGRLSCHAAMDDLKGKIDYLIALAGNPNVGKSSLFNQLTGLGVVTANYPGKTVELNLATTRMDGARIGIMDLPGTYALGAVSDDQWVARQGILDGNPSAVIVILDSTNLERNLYLLFQLADLETPLVAALNLVDYAERLGLSTDVKELERLLGIPVVPTVATRGLGVDRLIHRAIEVAQSGKTSRAPLYRFDAEIEREIDHLSRLISAEMPQTPHGVPPRALAILLLEGDIEFQDETAELPGGKAVLAAAKEAGLRIHHHYGEPAPAQIARQRHRRAAEIARKVQSRDRRRAPEQLLWKASLHPVGGMAMLAGTLVAVFAFVYYVGGFLSEGLTGLWERWADPVVNGALHALFGDGPLAAILKWGFSDGILAALAVGIPYVLTFYLILAVMEDSGYLNSVAFLTDSVMHRLGLHGRAMIPLIAGAGCNVPAIIGTRVLTTMRERTIASTLVTLVPCSARTAVIMAMVAAILGVWAALGLFAILGLLLFAIGGFLNHMLPGKSTGLVMEMFPFRRPDPLTILRKTWYRFKDFTLVAAPIIVIGSVTLGAVYETGLIQYLRVPLAPFVEGWLRLPAVAGMALVIAVLRKELALQLLLTMALATRPDLHGQSIERVITAIMSPSQIFVYAVVISIYIPCVATIAVLARELGWRRAIGIGAFTIGLAFLLGGVIARLLALFA